MPNISNQEQSHSDMRLRENREELSKQHLTKDGQPDHRYKENRDSEESSNNSNNNNNSRGNRKSDERSSNNRSGEEDESVQLADIPTKADGTADMRYSESKEAVASGLIEKDEMIEEVMEHGHQQRDQQDQHQSSHLKKDGTEDKRYKENRSDRDDN